jgi:Protein of unknown function (DUF3261)
LRNLIPALMCCSLGAAGCVQHVARPAPPAALPEIRLAPWQLGASMNAAQRLTIRSTRNAQSGAAGASIEAVVQVDATSLRVVALALGRRVFALQWDGVNLTEQRDARLPASLSATRILRDIQFAYWPVDALRTSLPPDWRIETGKDSRTLVHGAATMLLRARFSSPSRWQGTTTIENFAEGYELAIESEVQVD